MLPNIGMGYLSETIAPCGVFFLGKVHRIRHIGCGCEAQSRYCGGSVPVAYAHVVKLVSNVVH